MKTNKIKLLKISGFLAGLILLMVFFYNSPSLNAANINNVFVWTSCFLMYAVIWFPFFLLDIKKAHIENLSVKLTLWICCAVFVFFSAILSFFVGSKVLRIDVAILVQFLVIFLFCLNVYLALVWQYRSYKNAMTGESQAKKLSLDLRTRIVLSVDSLALRAGGLKSDYAKEKERILNLPLKARAINDSAVIEAAVMEQNIMSRLTAFTAVFEAVLSGASNDAKALEQSLENLESLIDQRTKMNEKKS